MPSGLGLYEDLTCAVCCEIYEEAHREPALLPKCGHSFCRPCLLILEDAETSFLCPTCRTPHMGSSVSEMPTIYALLSVSRKATSELPGSCRFHGKPLELWCTECCKEMCEACYAQQENDKRKCPVVSIKVVIEEKKNEIFEIAKHISLQIKKEQMSLSQRLNAIAKEHMVIYEQSKVLKGLINEVEETEKITRKSQELFNLKKTLCDIKSIHSQVSEATQDKIKSSQGSTSLEIGIDDEINRGSSSERMSQGSSQMSSSTDTLASSALNIGEAATSWALQMNVPGCTDSWPKVPWKEFMNQLPSAQLLVTLDTPEVFFDLTAGETSLGRIIIRLWGHMNRAQHFLALCLGTMGPTYKGSSFSILQESYGRFLCGGYYNTNEGTTSAHGIMNDLEWDGKYRQDIRKGLIAGWSYQKPDKEATFGIACGENFSGHLYSPFGEVSSGMDVVDTVSMIEPITNVKIIDCGLITSQNMIKS